MITPMVRDLLEAIGADHHPARATTCWAKFKPSVVCSSKPRSTWMRRRAYRRLAGALATHERYDPAAGVYQNAFHNGTVNLLPAPRMIINCWKAAAD